MLERCSTSAAFNLGRRTLSHTTLLPKVAKSCLQFIYICLSWNWTRRDTATSLCPVQLLQKTSGRLCTDFTTCLLPFFFFFLRSQFMHSALIRKSHSNITRWMGYSKTLIPQRPSSLHPCSNPRLNNDILWLEGSCECSCLKGSCFTLACSPVFTELRRKKPGSLSFSMRALVKKK